MEFIEEHAITAGKLYLGFFIVSFSILALILLSGAPAMVRGAIHAFRFQRARRNRKLRTLASPEELEAAGSRIEGLTLFEEARLQDFDPDQADEDMLRLMFDAA